MDFQGHSSKYNHIDMKISIQAILPSYIRLKDMLESQRISMWAI